MKRSFTVRQGALDGVEAFLGVARHHSFRKAADELGVTTSAVSQAIRALEARVCLALFIRTTRTAKMRWATYWRLRAVDAALDEQRLFGAAGDLGQLHSRVKRR
jgi:DNA-binding transcriptional LysR family regulator